MKNPIAAVVLSESNVATKKGKLTIIAMAGIQPFHLTSILLSFEQRKPPVIAPIAPSTPTIIAFTVPASPVDML